MCYLVGLFWLLIGLTYLLLLMRGHSEIELLDSYLANNSWSSPFRVTVSLSSCVDFHPFSYYTLYTHKVGHTFPNVYAYTIENNSINPMDEFNVCIS